MPAAALLVALLLGRATVLAAGAAPRFARPPVIAASGAAHGVALAAAPQTPRLLERGIREWLVAGPVPVVSDSARVARDYLGGLEARVAPTHGATDGGLHWAVAVADQDGHLNLNRVFGRAVDQALAYAAQYVRVPEDGTYLLRVRSDDDLVVYLNGRRIWVNEIARSVVTGEDSLVVRLAGGWNLLLLKVINQHGGFGAWARLDAFPDHGPAPDLLLSAIRPREFEMRQPAPVAVVEAVELGPRLRIGWQDLYALVTVRARPWGEGVPDRLWIEVAAESAEAAEEEAGRIGPVARDFAARRGEAEELRVWIPFSRLSAAARDGRPLAGAAGFARGAGPPASGEADRAAGVGSDSAGESGATRLHRTLAAAELLALLTRPIEPAHLRTLPRGAPERALYDVRDRHWLRTPPPAAAAIAALGLRFPIPVELDALSLELDAAHLDGASRILVNGRDAGAKAGRVVVCSPCALGDTIAVAVTLPPRDSVLLDGAAAEAVAAAVEPPVLRVREPGYAEVAAALEWWTFWGGPQVTMPDAERKILLASVESPGKTTYLRMLRHYRTLYSADAQRIRRDTLRLVGNSHIDAAWLWRWPETVEVVRDTWRSALRMARRFPDFVFAQSSAQYYQWMEEREPELFARVRDAIAAGRWVPVGGWWVEPDQNLPAGEALVRQGLYGQRYFKSRFGRYARVAWTPDSFGHAWTLPQILRGQGFEFFVTQKLRWNDSTRFPLDVFRWEAPDGTAIFTYIPFRYNDSLEPRRLAEELREYREKTGGLSDQLILYGVGDHGGGPTLDMLERWQEMARVETYPALAHTSPEAALDRIRASRGEFPTWRDELYLEYHRGTYTTHADIKRRNRVLEARLETAEKLAVASAIPYPHEELERAWKRVLFNQFHDILPGSGIREIYDDAHAFYDEAERLLDDVIARAATALAVPGAPGSFTVFNPLSAARGGSVEIPERALAEAGAGDVHVLDGHGQPHPVEVDERGTVSFFAPEVPGLGFRTFRAAAGPAASPATRALRAGRTWIENDLLRVTFAPATGEITSIYDKRARREVLASGGRANRIQVFGDLPAQWDAWNIGYTGEEWVVRDVELFRTDAGAGAARAIIGRRFGRSRFDQIAVLRPSSPVLEIEHMVDWREEHRLAKLVFPVAVHADSAAFEIPYGVIRRSTRPRTPAERAKWEVSGQRWIDLSAADASYGVSILNDGKYGFDVRGSVMRVTLLRAPTNPDSTADRGTHRFRIGIYPHAGSWAQARTPHLAAAFNAPLIAFAGAVADYEPIAALDADHVAITAIKAAEDEPDALVFRLVDLTGAGGAVRLRVRGGPWNAREADLLERPAEAPLPAEGDQLVLTFRPWEIKTVILRPR